MKPASGGGDFTSDQRPSDAFSLNPTTRASRKNETAILGWPRVLLNVSASAPLADWFARLSDVAPDGSVTLITGAGQSGAQRDSWSDPERSKTRRVQPPLPSSCM